ncbi:MAG: hypothetical protein PF637_06030 [Spirochaetes bacterium]|jgi:hypothetical protein|nr:hypothetical protein [Spirochaetota bacterium]
MSGSIEGLDAVVKALTGLKSIPAGRINKYRSKAFMDFMEKKARSGSLALRSVSEATKKIHGKDHKPLYNKGEMLRVVKARHGKHVSIAGWLKESGTPKGSKIDWRSIVGLHMTGYRVPLFGEKGRKVRGFLASKGIFPRKEKRYIVVTSRDILGIAYRQYEITNRDIDIAKKGFAAEIERLF